MRKALAPILSIALLAAGCGDDQSVLTTEGTGTTATTAGAETTVTTEAGSTETTVTTAAPEPEVAGTLAALAEGRVRDPLMDSGWHRLDWADEEQTVLQGRRGTTGSDDLDLLVLVDYESAPAVTGKAADDVLVHAFLGFPSMDVPPGALVIYSPDEGDWRPSLVITDEQILEALLETTDYAAAAPGEEAPMNLMPNSLDLGTSMLVAMIEVLDVGEGDTAYEGEIQCDFSGGPLTCITLTDDGVLRPGDEGEDVEALQQELKDLGYLSGAVDGKYGPGTRAAVREFQRDFLLTRDGKVGPMTRDVLDQVLAGTLLLASQNGVGSIPFGTASEASYADLVAAFGVPDSTTGWFVDGCDLHDWFKATWDGFTAIFTDRDGTRQFDGWEVDDLSDLPTGLYIKGGIHSGTDWGDLDAMGADFYDDYLGQRWRIPAMGYSNGRFTGPVTNPPAANSPIKSFGTGTRRLRELLITSG